MHVTWLLIAAVALGSTAEAQVDDQAIAAKAKEDQIAELKSKAEFATAQAALLNAQTAKATAQINALSLTGGDGKATLGANGGTIEAWMLSAASMTPAALWVVDDLASAFPETTLQTVAIPSNANLSNDIVASNDSSGLPIVHSINPDLEKVAGVEIKPVVKDAANSAVSAVNSGTTARPKGRLILLAGEEAFSPIATGFLTQRIQTQLDSLKAPYDSCKAIPGVKIPDEGGAGPLIPLIALGVNLLKTSSEVSGIDVPLKDRTLATAVGRRLARLGYDTVMPAAALVPSMNSEMGRLYQNLGTRMSQSKACRTALNDLPKTKVNTEVLAKLDATLKKADAFNSEVLKADETGATPLGRGLASEGLVPAGTLVLRVFVEKAGGSLLKRQNLWTALGFPAIGITGGLVISYTLTDPAGGYLRRSGIGVCRTAMTSMRAVQNGDFLTEGSQRIAKCSDGELPDAERPER